MTNTNTYFSTTPIDFEFINRISNELPAPNWLIWIVIVEISIIVFGLLWSIVIAGIFIRRPIFHVNVIGITTNMFFGYSIMNLCRLCVLVASIFDQQVLNNRAIFLTLKPFFYFELLRIASGCSAIASMFWIVFERIVASIKLASYEKTTSPTLVTAAILTSWCAGISMSLFLYGSPIEITLSLLSAGCLIAFVGISFCAVNRWNSNRLKNSRKNTNALTLTQRYQLQETIWLLTIIRRWIIVFSVVISVVLVTLGIGLSIQTTPDSNAIFYVRSLGNVICGIGGSLIISAGITGCRIWREDLKKKFRTLMARRVMDIQPQPRVVRNFKGQQLLFNVAVERDLHFGQLKEAWN
ncbi:hypothetical protein M3Y95_00972700 [Aphelenchoides besseyi]|nr:hypothetical protein M3Y95_00972700 [Aphelenchoides besseyi]